MATVALHSTLTVPDDALGRLKEMLEWLAEQHPSDAEIHVDLLFDQTLIGDDSEDVRDLVAQMQEEIGKFRQAPCTYQGVVRQ